MIEKLQAQSNKMLDKTKRKFLRAIKRKSWGTPSSGRVARHPLAILLYLDQTQLVAFNEQRY